MQLPHSQPQTQPLQPSLQPDGRQLSRSNGCPVMVQILGSLSVGTVSLPGSDSQSQPVPPSTISKQVGGNIKTDVLTHPDSCFRIFLYKIKIINRNKKSEFCLRHLHDLTCKFKSVYVLCAKLIDFLGDQIT